MIRIKKRLKALLPALKEKNRYLAFEIVSGSKIRDSRAVSSQIKAAFSGLFGEFSLAKANIVLLQDKWRAEKQKGIIKVNHNYAHQLKTSLLFIDRIRNNDAIIKSIGMSGILKKAQSKYMAG